MSDLTEDLIAPGGVTSGDEGGENNGGDDGGGRQEPATPELYTPEEVEKILVEGGNLDSKRLTPEARLIQKSFERGFTKKFEEISDIKKTLEEAVKPKDVIEKWTDMYMDDPEGVSSFVYGQIQQLERQADPLDPDNYKVFRAQIAALQGDLDRVKERAKAREVMSTKIGSIPDDIRSFAKAQGFTDKELLNSKVLKAVTALHKAEKGAENLKQYVKKKDPTQVEAPGSGGGGGKKEAKSMEDLFYGG